MNNQKQTITRNNTQTHITSHTTSIEATRNINKRHDSVEANQQHRANSNTPTDTDNSTHRDTQKQQHSIQQHRQAETYKTLQT